MTILELLVVMLILLMVTAAAIPIVAPAMQNRRMRESARLVSSYFSTARSRAIETGRPVGVMIERFNGQPFAFQLSQVEVPPPYAGDGFDSRIKVDGAGNITEFVSGDLYWKGLVRYGDQVRLDYRGPDYVLASVVPVPATGDPKVGQVIADDPSAVNWPLATRDGVAPSNIPTAYGTDPGVPFQIIRQPTRSSTAPLQLPEPIVVDLTCSGMGTGGTFLSPASYAGATTSDTPPYDPPVVSFDPVVLFSPSGRLEAVSNATNGQLSRPTDAVYVLLGRRDLMFDATQKNVDASDAVNQNLSPIPGPTAVITNTATWPAPPPHFWVAIGYQTGLVTVAEVAPNFQDYQTAGRPLTQVITDALFTDPPVAPDNLTGARQFARQSQSVGGR